MHASRAEIQKRLRVMIPVGIAVGAAAIIGAWLRYLAVASNDVAAEDIWSRPGVWLTLALVATVAAPPILFFAVRNYVWLIKFGQEVPGRVTSIGRVTHSGATPVTYAYTVDGIEHTMRRDTPNTDVERFQVGSQVIILVDPKRPKRATVLGLDE